MLSVMIILKLEKKKHLSVSIDILESRFKMYNFSLLQAVEEQSLSYVQHEGAVSLVVFNAHLQ